MRYAHGMKIFNARGNTDDLAKTISVSAIHSLKKWCMSNQWEAISVRVGSEELVNVSSCKQRRDDRIYGFRDVESEDRSDVGVIEFKKDMRE
jgi:hypothetical protein